MFSFPHNFAPDRKFLFKIKNKHKPRKAKKFKFRADTATSITPRKLPQIGNIKNKKDSAPIFNM